MPNNGQILEAWKTPANYGWPEMALRCQSTATVIDSDTYNHSAMAVTHWVPNVIDKPIGMRLTVASSWDGTTGHWEVHYDGPGAPFGGFVRSGAVYLSTVSIEVRPQALLIYSKLTGSLWRIVYTGLAVYVNDVLDSTLTGLDTVSEGVGPSYIPILGIPVYLSGGVGGTNTSIPEEPGIDSEGLAEDSGYDPCDPGAGLPVEIISDVSSVVSGGWRWFVDGSWQDLPVHVDVRNAPNAAGCENLSVTGVVGSSRTWGSHLQLRSKVTYRREYVGRETPSDTWVDFYCGGVLFGHYTGPGDTGGCIDPCTGLPGAAPFRDVYKERFFTETQNGTIRLQPNLDHPLVRMGQDHAALMFRGHFPEARGTASRTCTVNGVTSSASQTHTLYPDLSQFLGVVSNPTHALEDCLAKPMTAPVTASRYERETIRYKVEGTSFCPCPWPWFTFPSCPPGELAGFVCGATYTTLTNYNRSESVGWSFPSYVGAGGEHQFHFDDEARYLGSWCNPFWIIGYWTDRELVDGNYATWAEYWGPIRQQTFQNPFLPGDERTKQRNHLILSPAENEQGHAPFLDFAFGGLRWAGVSRWKRLEVDIPANLQLSLARPGEWAPRNQSGTDDCTVTLGMLGVTLSAFNVAEAWVELDLAQWTTDPWLLLQLANQVLVDWSTANVDSLRVELVGRDQAVTVLGTAGGTYAMFPSGRLQVKYAGSWAIDNGNLVVPDLGVDTDMALGMSSTIMGDPETVMAFQLAYGQNYRALRFVVTPTSLAGSVSLDWPKFWFPTTHPVALWESGKCCAFMWPAGPSFRTGQNTWYIPGLGFQDPPVPMGQGVAVTMVDALATSKRLLTGTGTAALATDITGDLSNYLDTYEGPVSIAVADKLGMAVPLPEKPGDATLRWAMINSFAEVPPVSCFPTRRMESDWSPGPTSPYWAGVYDWTERYRHLISGGAQCRLQDEAGNNVGAPMTGMPTGFYGWKYAPALDNDEANWRVVVGTKLLAKVRPWTGWLCIVGAGLKRSPAVLETWEPRYVRATVDALTANVVLEHALYSTPPYLHETVVTTTGDCSEPCLCEDTRATSGLILTYTRTPSVGPAVQGTYERWSYDLGQTWQNEAVGFVGGRQSRVRAGNQSLVRSAFVYDAGTSGPGTIVATVQGDGDNAPSDPFTWKDDGGSELSVEDTGYDFDFAPDLQNRWVASFTVAGEGTTSDWWSTDEGRTWTRA